MSETQMPQDDTQVVVNDSLSIPRAELDYSATRSGGPGGQHVNTSSTRIELTWNVADSPALTEEQRQRILTKLSNRIDASGTLRLAASSSRSQHRNREEATERFAQILAEALRVSKPRKKTRLPRAAKEARLQEKKRRSEAKSRRGRVRNYE